MSEWFDLPPARRHVDGGSPAPPPVPGIGHGRGERDQVAAPDALADRDRLAEDLASLVAVPSVTGSASETALQHLLADRLQQAGFAVDLWQLDLDVLTRDPGFPGWEADRSEAWGLVGELTPAAGDAGDGPTVVLNAHVDVVPPGDPLLWDRPAFTPHRGEDADGRDAVFGRGACDMKAGLVAVLAAVETLRSEGLPRRGRIQVQCVVGEEDGGLGTFATLRRGHRGDVAVIPEPTSCELVPACAGALTFRLTVPGKAAHGSSRREGVSAVEAFWPVWRALHELESRRNADPDPLMHHLDTPYAISLGTLHAGDWASTVPDLLVAEGRLGVALDETVDDARRALVDAVAAACRADAWLSRHPATVEFTGGQFASGRTPVDDPLVDAVTRAHQRVTGDWGPAVRGLPSGSDLRLLRAAGTSVVHYGPGSLRSAHSPNESVPVAEVEQTARVLVETVRSLCG
ncbi:ArgE/DapE family deacylase [Thalassiella azotivora]